MSTVSTSLLQSFDIDHSWPLTSYAITQNKLILKSFDPAEPDISLYKCFFFFTIFELYYCFYLTKGLTHLILIALYAFRFCMNLDQSEIVTVKEIVFTPSEINVIKQEDGKVSFQFFKLCFIISQINLFSIPPLHTQINILHLCHYKLNMQNEQ